MSEVPLPAATAIRICECWSRDGIQPWADVVPTEMKLAVLRAVSRAGVRQVDLTALTRAPQFADSVGVLHTARAERLFDGVRVLAINMHSMQTVAELDRPADLVDTCGFPISASDAHNRANLRRSLAERRREVQEMVAASRALGIEPLLCISTAFGCPIEGEVPAARVEELAEWAVQLGVRRLMLADTTGMAHPGQVHELFSRIGAAHPDAELIAHLHDTRGTGIANAFAAMAAGVRTFDTALGGSGGEPAGILPNQRGATGNLCTEDFVAVVSKSGYETGIHPEALLVAGELAERAYGGELRSQVLRAGW